MADYISQVTLPDGNSYFLKDININNIYYGTCSSASSDQTKTVEDCPNFPTGNNLTVGTVIFISFSNLNTATENLKLRVNSSNSTDEKPIKYLCNGMAQDLPSPAYIQARHTYQFFYDGTNWVMNINTNTDSHTVYQISTTTEDNANYPILFAHQTINASDSNPYSTQRIDSIFVNPHDATVTATTFVGNLTGVAGTAKMLIPENTNGTIGNTITPIYLNEGVATACNVYAGGTKVILNTNDKSATEASFYAPTSQATARYQLLVSGNRIENNNGIYDPQWTPAATLQSNLGTQSLTTLTLGNSATNSNDSSEGQIVLYSSNTHAHIIKGASTTTAYTHILPNDDGWIVSGSSGGVAIDKKTLMYLTNTGTLTASDITVGSNNRPVYLNAGTLTALDYIQNRLYYSDTTSSFVAGTYFADGSGIAINKNSLTSGYKLEVNGSSLISGNIDITGNITPTTNNSYSLGLGGQNNSLRWSAVYIGSANGYGDAYTPIYWNNGVPTAITSILCVPFEITGGKKGVTLQHSAFTTKSYVLQIVVTSGADKLTSPITWNSNTTEYISLQCTTTVSDTVQGYILVSRGADLTGFSSYDIS